MLHPTTAAALAKANQDDIERMLRDPGWQARQEVRREARARRRAAIAGFASHAWATRRKVAAAMPSRATSPTA